MALLYLNHSEPRAWPEEDLGFIREVAERTRVAVERRRAEEELADLAASLEQQVADRTAALLNAEEALRQSQKMEAVGQLTGGLAHDFNNLLTVIRGSVDLLRRPDVSVQRREKYVDAIADTAERAARLTSQLLAFSRRQTLKPEIFDASEAVQAIQQIVHTLVGSRVAIEIDLPEEPCTVLADRSQFDTALLNMAVNARDAMDGEGRMIFTVGLADQVPAIRSHPATSGAFVTVSVGDTGTGLTPDVLERIFEPFFTTKSVGQGTGLGLSQVFGFTKQSGGDVIVRNGHANGAVFTMYLPAAVLGAESAAEMPLEVAPTIGEGACVLVVEDNPEVGSFATQALAELGYDAVLAADAAAALERLAAPDAGFDIVFSDVVMPGMSGIELGQEIRRLHPGLPVILASGYSSVLADSGTHGFQLLQKPYSIDELSRVLRKLA